MIALLFAASGLLIGNGIAGSLGAGIGLLLGAFAGAWVDSLEGY